LKKGDLVEGIVREVKFPNKGIVETEEGAVVVKNAITGQRVQSRINKKRKGKAEGALLSVLERSPLEIETPCPAFGTCGGCTYLCLPYEEQLKIKEAQVRELLTEAMPQDTPMDWFQGILGSPSIYGYRNKMEFSFGDEYKDGPLALGMHKRGSFYDLVNAEPCVIVDEDYRKILHAVRTYWSEKGASFYHRLRHEGYLRHLLVRKAVHTGEILIDLVTTSQEEYDLSEFANMLLSLHMDGKIVGILHTVNDAVADVIKDDGTEILYGQDYFTESLLGLSFKVTPFSFFQTNSRGAEVLYDTARTFLTDAGMKKGVVYDLYCGTGTISQLMAPVSEKVIGVEIVEEAVVAARENALRNDIHNCEFIAGDVLKVLDEIKEMPDLIILDPPRDGVHPKALPKILGYGVEQILYISCKPTSLARDIPAFLEAGYKPVRGISVDQFPWTANVETIILFQKQH
jgi:23S rRNA (uracil-5-)-methyltransferase RumA